MAEKTDQDQRQSRQFASLQAPNMVLPQSNTQPVESKPNEQQILLDAQTDQNVDKTAMAVELGQVELKNVAAQEIPLFTQTDFEMVDNTVGSSSPTALMLKQSQNINTTMGDEEQQHSQQDQFHREVEYQEAVDEKCFYEEEELLLMEQAEEEDAVVDEENDREEEERAVADFVSGMELHHHNGKKQSVIMAGRQTPPDEAQNQATVTGEENEDGEREKEDDAMSRQFSVDDVTDDEDDQQVVEEAERAIEEEVGNENDRQTEISRLGEGQNQVPYGQPQIAQRTEKSKESSQQQQFHRNDKSGLEKFTTDQSGATQTNAQPHSTANDSTTIQDSQSSNKASTTQKRTSETHAAKLLQQQKEDVPPPSSSGPPIADGAQTINTAVANQRQASELSISPRKAEPTLNREDFVAGHMQKFLAHVETREIGANACPESSKLSKLSKQKTSALDGQEEESARSSSQNSSDSGAPMKKDNEDPNAKVESKADQFDPKEFKQEFDGWSLYKKMRISFAPVRRYQCLVDQDYKKNKVTVCAHLQNIYNSFSVKRGRPTYQMSNFFDIEKWLTKMGNTVAGQEKPPGGASSPAKELRRVNTLAAMLNNADEQPRERENYLLTKSNSTAHIPDNIRNTKNAKRAYGNFDKDLAPKMFGYRVIFQKRNMEINVPEPEASQAHKPIQRYVNDIMGELSQSYHQMHRFHTKQRILIPLPDDSDEEVTIVDQQQSEANATGDQTAILNETGKRSTKINRKDGEIVLLRTRNGDRQTFLKRTKNLFWHCAPLQQQRQQSATSHTKRGSYSKNNQSSTIYGSQSINQAQQSAYSPAKRDMSISPKKTMGWNQGSQQKQVPQTSYQMIAKMNQVRYAMPRQGTSHPPANSIRLYAGGGSCNNQQYGNFRRQNSYRKNHQRSLRGDSAKGVRGMRQSTESTGAYRLTHHGMTAQEHNFIWNDGQRDNSMQDSEVAHITRQQQQQQQPQNIVKLRDPKHIEGFGSDVVHVNVSCSQTLPEKAPNNAEKKAAAQNEDDEDSQTFVIQLSEEQTRQLASGNLKLNGVPIPKDLSNLSYDQIMALLDSVNLPPHKSAAQTSAGQKKQEQTTIQQPTSTPMNDKNRILDQKVGSEGARKNQTIPGRDALPSNQKPKHTTSFKQNHNNRFMGHTFSGSNAAGVTPMTNHEFFRSQQAQYGLGSNITSTAEQNAIPPGIAPIQNPAMPKSSSVIDSEPIRMKPGRDIAKNQNMSSGARQNSHPTAAQTLHQRLVDSASLNPPNQRMTRQQAASHGSTKMNPDQLRSQQNNSQLSQQNARNQAMAGSSDWEMLAMIGKHSQQLRTTQNLKIGQMQQATENGRKLLQGAGGYYQHSHAGGVVEQIVPVSSSTKNNNASGSKGGIQAALPGINSIKHTKNVVGPLYTNNQIHNGAGGNTQAPPPFIEFDPAQFVGRQPPAGVGPSHHQSGATATRSSQQMMQSVVGSASAQMQSQSQGGGGSAGHYDLASTIGLNNIRLQHPQSTAAASSHHPMIPPQQQQYFLQQQQNQQRSIARLESKKVVRKPGQPIVAGSGTTNGNFAELKGSSSRSFLKATGGGVSSSTQQQSARMQNQINTSSGMSKVKSASTAATQNTGQQVSAGAQRNALFPGGKLNTNLLPSENQLLNGQHSAPQHMAFQVMKGSPQQQKPYSDLMNSDQQTAVGSQSTHKRVSNESLPLGVQLLNRYYQSGAEKMGSHHKKNAIATTSTPNSTNITTGGHPLKQSTFTVTKNNKISKTSIELEYSKFDHPRQLIKQHLPQQTAAPKILSGNMQFTAQTSNQQSRKNLMHHSHERGAGVTTTQYYQRMNTENTTDMVNPGTTPQQNLTGGKLRLLHHNGNPMATSTNYASAAAAHNNNSGSSSTHKQQRKIESALAQSAINAIQNQSIHHHGGMLQIPTTTQPNFNNNNNNQFLKFEHKAMSQPQNQLLSQQQHYQNFQQQQQQQSQQHPVQPPFIMRNNLNKSGEQTSKGKSSAGMSYAQQYAAATAIASSDYIHQQHSQQQNYHQSHHNYANLIKQSDQKNAGGSLAGGGSITTISSAMNTTKTSVGGGTGGVQTSTKGIGMSPAAGSNGAINAQRQSTNKGGLLSSKP